MSYPLRQGLLADWATVPQDVKNLTKYFKQLRNDTAGVLPSTCNTDAFRAALTQGDAEEDEALFKVVFTGPPQEPVPTLDWTRDIVAKSRQNKSRVVSEAHWNSSVHHNVLDAALQDSRFREKLLCDNITTASISSTVANDDLIPNCKVDFCMSLQLERSFVKPLASADICLTHTDYFPTTYNPIAVSIETKNDQAETPKAQVQLSTWAAAHISHLRMLLYKAGNPNAQIPPLPLVMVAGDAWTLWCFRDEGGGGQGGSFFSDGFHFGNTATILGCYQAIAGLRNLASWAETIWRPWFTEQILDPLLSRISTPREAG
ncbi:hypothetical protein M409DRAFT_70685 [Zasmidium cellare ATCC 36951]|uniref:PD-(D/E)XK nuclease-like domain-containing protein n=1 Tax=Zasmidium cellare ATCC 36951 TaxID=1080233 RepID=A0A6A6BZ23_ZASCE|nr:uncharacterized protein M409DRAFT_70685 [Zasmidium cellare ATCC 36951]KAF2160041.1 hypothetical protein M409DRAFT_70685 [Zasmidium cellare ATCC 36951]